MKSLVLLCVIALSFACQIAQCDLVITNADRQINLKTQIATQVISLDVRNDGKATEKQMKLAFLKHPSLISVESENGKELPVVPAGHDGDFVVYTAEFDEPLTAGQATTIIVSAKFTHTMSPHPSEITQAQKQQVVYQDSYFIPSIYLIDSQETVISTVGHIQSHSELEPFKKTGEELTVGPFNDVAAGAYSELQVHFENNEPFGTVNKMTQVYEISHWGNVAVEEHLDIEHSGARLVGSFSRLDFLHGMIGNSISQFTQYLPSGSKDIYYRDVIGNISTSHVSESDDGRVKFEWAPRFNLFGGWKTQHYQGYNLPADKCMGYSEEGALTLDVPLGADFGDSLVIDELEVKFVLPEGSNYIEIHCDGIEFERIDDETHFTYLDTSGRPVVGMRTKNLIGDHNKLYRIQVTYYARPFSMFQEPILLVVAYFALFLVVIGLVRVDLSIEAVDDSVAIRKSEQISETLAHILTLQESREKLYDRLKNESSKSDSVVSKLGSLKDQMKEYGCKLESIGAAGIEKAELIRALEYSEQLRLDASIKLKNLLKNGDKVATEAQEEDLTVTKKVISDESSQIADIVNALRSD